MWRCSKLPPTKARLAKAVHATRTAQRGSREAVDGTQGAGDSVPTSQRSNRRLSGRHAPIIGRQSPGSAARGGSSDASGRVVPPATLILVRLILGRRMGRASLTSDWMSGESVGLPMHAYRSGQLIGSSWTTGK